MSKLNCKIYRDEAEIPLVVEFTIEGHDLYIECACLENGDVTELSSGEQDAVDKQVWDHIHAERDYWRELREDSIREREAA